MERGDFLVEFLRKAVDLDFVLLGRKRDLGKRLRFTRRPSASR